jgi:hypothetical protein
MKIDSDDELEIKLQIHIKTDNNLSIRRLHQTLNWLFYGHLKG